MYLFAVNRGNSTIIVTDDDGNQIGRIYPNEVCTRCGGEE